MSDYTDVQEEQARQKVLDEQRNEELRQLYKLLLKRDPTAQEYGLDREGSRANVGIKILKQHQKELATGKQGDNQYQPGLTDPAQRERFRQFVRSFGSDIDRETLTPAQLADPNFSVLRDLNAIPVSFLRPDLTVRRDEVDTPEEVTRYLQRHGGDSQINRELLKAALDYGGLSIEPTPFGTQQRVSQAKWKAPDGPGEIESRLLRAGRPLTPQELSAIAQERQGAFRLEDDGKGIWRQVAKAILAATFAYAGGAVAGPFTGALVGGSGGLGLGGTAGGIAGGAAAGAAGGLAAGGIGSGGDMDAIWRAMLTGAITGGIGGGLPSVSGPGLNALKGAGIGAAGNVVGQGLGGDGFDWTKFLQSVVTGGASGAASGLGGDFPGSELVSKMAGSTGNAFLNAAGHDPLANANQQLDANALKREQDQQAAMTQAQADWKAKYTAASQEARAAQLEAFRAAQQEFESKKAEYEAKLQAFLDERQSQIQEALRAMGLAEPGIAGLLADRQKQIEAAKAEQAQQQATLVESRNYFPSELLTQTGDTGASSLLVPHSPPPVLFGQEGLPASYTDYAQAPAPTFSGEGFLPSGSLASGASPPSVAPLSPTRPPQYFPTLLNGLTRSPYLRYA